MSEEQHQQPERPKPQPLGRVPIGPEHERLKPFPIPPEMVGRPNEIRHARQGERIDATLDPAYLAVRFGHPGEDWPNDAVFKGMKSAIERVHREWPMIVRAVRARRASMLETAAKREQMAGEIARKAGSASWEVADRALAAAEAEAELLAKVMDSAPPPAPPTAGEIRAHFKSLAPSERLLTAIRAIKALDETTVGSILGRDTPGYLSGFEPKDLEDLRRRWRKAKHGAEWSRRKAILAAMQQVEKARSALYEHTQALLDDKLVEKAERLELEAVEAAKAIGT